MGLGVVSKWLSDCIGRSKSTSRSALRAAIAVLSAESAVAAMASETGALSFSALRAAPISEPSSTTMIARRGDGSLAGKGAECLIHASASSVVAVRITPVSGCSKTSVGKTSAEDRAASPRCARLNLSRVIAANNPPARHNAAPPRAIPGGRPKMGRDRINFDRCVNISETLTQSGLPPH